MDLKPKDKTLIILAGPTASGKTDIAHSLALRLSCDIISSDSRQCISEFGIAVAKPPKEYLKEIDYHFINIQSFTEHSNLQSFIDCADRGIAQSFEKCNFAIMAGGTGLYIKAWKEGVDQMEQIHRSIRQQVQELLDNKGKAGLVAALENHQDSFTKSPEAENTARLQRALEVRLQTGKSILEHQKGIKREHNFKILEFALAPERELLLKRIEKRTQNMMQKGLWAEALKFYPYRGLKNLATVGYQEVFQALDENKNPVWAEEQIFIHTRQYAKRQMTWFRNQGDFRLIDPSDAESEILAILGK